MKLKFLITVPDKYTREEYKAGEIYEFDDKRAEEILKARTAVTKEPYAVEYIEPIAEVINNIGKTEEEIEVKPKKKRKAKKDN